MTIIVDQPQIDALNQNLASERLTYADLIIQYLVQIDVEYIFGIPGGGIEPLFNAIARHLRDDGIEQDSPTHNIIPTRKRGGSTRIRPIIARHESGAAFMADGYARETGRLGVCCATTGPGSTNLITGVASAYADRVPMLVITPQTALPDFGKLGLQESSSDAIDVVGMFEHCTRYNTLVSHPNQLEGKLYTALIHAFRHPRGPVHLSIPRDILNATTEKRSTGYQVAHLFRQPKVMDEDAYAALVADIIGARQVVIMVGGGSRHAVNSITKVAEHLNAPMVSTPAGKRWVNVYHPQYRGVYGFAGHRSAIDAVLNEDVDLLLAIGTSLGELSTCSWSNALLNEKLVHISNTPEDFSRSPMARLHVLGDITTIFNTLHHDLMAINSSHPRTGPGDTAIEHTEYRPPATLFDDIHACYSDATPLKPQRVMRELATRLPKDTRYLADAGNAWAWTTHYLMTDSNGNHRCGFGYGAMTWAIGASVGTALGCREHPVVCITGDGSFLMSGQEITTAVAERLPMIFVVLNDQAYGMVKHGQRMGKAEPIGYELPPVDFAQMARAMGANGHTLRSPDDFARLDYEAMCSSTRPTLLDVYINPEELPPIGLRVKTLGRITGQRHDQCCMSSPDNLAF